MTSNDPSAPVNILLVGAGHAHLVAIPALRRALPHARITLIDPGSEAAYSGMLPGVVAGHYPVARMMAPLDRIARMHKIHLLRASVTGIDPERRLITLIGPQGAGTRSYDIASVDIGSHACLGDMPGFREHGAPVKPVGPFQRRWQQFRETAPPRSPVVLIGAGLAGVEIAFAIQHVHDGPVTVIDSGRAPLAGLPPRAGALLRGSMAAQGIVLVSGRRVARVGSDHVELDDGQRIACAFAIGAGGARAYDWPGATLPVDGSGFIRVNADLRVMGRNDLFAAGDCAVQANAPRPRAGVYAVRQGPVLAANIAALADGRALQAFQPQRDYLKLISLGGRQAVAVWKGMSIRGRAAWMLKDRIDRSFMASLAD
ncbi:FAD-dependent oxidoreductase [Paracoccus sp. 1_MG-2023]|uniref:FAD-dependent oxidoreductase n=1 Tax=unclassified Paracoccus (in: a-proteobacteria) TaxID=2688777 RepID=UPI001C092AF5|nr:MULTISPECIES: FAD-dependent oxidoreductase [unclassified Paracoccus (in: a-proteobacteria)]MBU2957776.1 FAD-dependent oxidoreductase [Paracoccus sp. C2R09]MDO6667376.1 FAD-dependent oxidoreductase [Paracoccus sp. 1_MG-2023]